MLRLTLILLMTGCPLWAAKSAAVAQAKEYKAFSLDGYFSCEVPQKWQLSRDANEEQKSGVFQIELMGPHAQKVPVTAYVSYFSKTNKYFKDYKDYVDSNSTDDLGIAPETDKYGPVKTAALGGRKVFAFEREKKEYLHPESKSDESVMLREKFYVLPAKDGFFVFHFSAPKAVFSKHLPVFERVARTFKGLP